MGLTLKLQELVKGGFLESSGERRGTTYHLRGIAPAGGARDLFASLEESASTDSARATLDDLRNERSPARSPAQSPAQSSARSAIAHIEGRRWSTREDMRAAILEICRDAHRSVSEIAGVVGRSERTVQQSYLRVLVREGLLELKYPDAPSHPDQRYRTKVVEPTP